MQFRSLALLVSLAISLTEAHIGGGSIALQDIRPQVYCGRSLSRALALLCYEDEGAEKRSDTGTMFGPVLAPYSKDHDSWPWMPPHRARSMSNQRGKRFVVSECCDKACSINELLSYC